MEEKDKAFLLKLEKRFIDNSARHKDVSWDYIKNILVSNNKYLEIIIRMDETGGEPDVVGGIDENGFVTVVDCSIEINCALLSTHFLPQFKVYHAA